MKIAHLAAFLLVFLSIAPANGQESRAYSRRNTFSFSTEYSNTSSHIILGVSQNRRLIAPGAAYTRRLLGSRYLEWDYAVEVRPLTFIQEPVALVTYTAIPPATGTVLPTQNGPTQRACDSGTTTVPPNPDAGFPGFVITRSCSTRWSYAGGVSPLGQRISIVPRNRLQPFIVGNAGFLASTHDVPADNSESFNFAFEFGAGLEFFRDHERSISAEYRIHHLSNAYRGLTNPGIDSQILKVTYSFGR